MKEVVIRSADGNIALAFQGELMKDIRSGSIVGHIDNGDVVTVNWSNTFSIYEKDLGE